MPIYAYRCSDCGHAQDVLQKLSDPVLTLCPACGSEAYAKQVTAAGFQLKGSGWYVTDFRNGNSAAPKPAADDARPAADAAAAGDKPAAAVASAAASATTTPAAAPAAAPAAPPPAASP